MYFIVTQISMVWRSLRYVQSANTQQIDTPLKLHSPQNFGAQNYFQIMPNHHNLDGTQLNQGYSSYKHFKECMS
jgi:hypothetical protein